MTQTDRILELAQQQTMLRAADVRALGCSVQLLQNLAKAGRLQRLSRGLYALPEAEPTEHQSLLEVCQRVPKAVVCLASALQFHEIGSQLPSEVWIALPAGTHAPTLAYPPLRVMRMGGEAYLAGVVESALHGAPIRVYSAAKTIADCFKFRNKIGLDVALEALKEAWRTRKVTMAELTHFARINRVEKVMQPYLESIAA